MKAVFCLLILFASVNLARAGFAGPPPFTNDSPLAERHGWKLSGDRIRNKPDGRVLICDSVMGSKHQVRRQRLTAGCSLSTGTFSKAALRRRFRVGRSLVSLMEE